MNYYIIYKNKEEKLIKSSVMSQKDANYYCMCLEVLHGVGSHVVLEEREVNNFDIKKIKISLSK